MCCDAPSPPDYGPIAQANEGAAQYAYQAANEDLAFRKQQYQDSLPRQQQLYDLASQVAQQQMGIAGANEQRAAQQWGQHQQTFRPLEQQMALESYGSQYLGDSDVAGLQAAIASGDQVAINRYAQMGAQGAGTQYQGMMDAADLKARGIAGTEAVGAKAAANADINSAYASQARGLMRMGGGQTNQMAAMAAQLAQQQALARVGAGNNVYRAVYDQERGVARTDAANQFGMTERGIGLRAGAASFGRNMPNTAAQAYGLSTQAGSSAVANQNAGYMSGLPYAQFQSGATGNQLGAAGMAQQGALGLGQLQNNMYGAQMQAHGAGMAGLGQLGGLAAYGAFISDPVLKSDVVLVGKHPLGIGIYEYTINGRREIGVMADEVEKVMPEAVVVSQDGYKRVRYDLLEV